MVTQPQIQPKLIFAAFGLWRFISPLHTVINWKVFNIIFAVFLQTAISAIARIAIKQVCQFVESMVHCLFHVIVIFLSQFFNFCYHNNALVWQLYFTVLVEWSDPQIPAVCRFVICDIFLNVTICRVLTAATGPVVVISIAKPTSFAFLLLYPLSGTTTHRSRRLWFIQLVCTVWLPWR